MGFGDIPNNISERQASILLAVDCGVWRHSEQYKWETGFNITSFQKNLFTNFSFELYKNSSKHGRDTTTVWQTADSLHFDTPKKEEKWRPEFKWTKEIYYAVAEKGSDEAPGKWLEKSGDWKTEKLLKFMNRLAGLLVVVWIFHSITILYINFIRTWVRKLLLCD